MTDHNELFKKPGISPTSINHFLGKGAAKFWRHSSYNPNRIKTETTPAMAFGRLVHSLVLTPDIFDTEYVVSPVKTDDHLDTLDDLKKFVARQTGSDASALKGSKQQVLEFVRREYPAAPIWDDVQTYFKLTVGNRTVVTKDQFDMAKSMQDQMFANHAVRNLIGNGFSEEPYCWFPEDQGGGEINPTDNAPRIMKKCRMDYNRAGLVIEYKTTISPDEDDFSKDIGNMGYHRQLAMQFDASTRKYGEAPRGAIIIAQDKEIHDDIAIWAIDPYSLVIATEEVDAAFEAIRMRMAANDWKSYPQEIRPIALPHWYKKQIAVY